MNIKDGKRWTFFGDFFEAVSTCGLDEMEAADALLAALIDGATALGYRRQFTFTTSGRLERLPRDTHPYPVPNTIWRLSGKPQGDLSSQWQDDPNEPEEWIAIDWLSGTLKSTEWELMNIELVHTEFTALRFPRKDAAGILQSLAGKPKKRAGRPQGPSNPWERAQVARAMQMIKEGDTRAPTALASQLTDRTLTGSALESQQRRLQWGITAALARDAKNSTQE